MNVKTLSLRLLCLMLLAGMAGSAGACSWAGRTAGKAHAKIERQVDSVESSYHKGYEDEKNKSAPLGQPANEPQT